MTSRHFIAFCLRQEDASTGVARFGFTVPRAIGKAVQRNRIKRRMREAVRANLAAAPANWAIVFNPRRSVLTAAFEELCRDTGRLFAKCNDF